MKQQEISKFLSFVLRHNPNAIKLSLDKNGWANVDELIFLINKQKGNILTIDILENIVSSDNKNRYSFNQDKTLIRANQGHSINVDVELKKELPPNCLYHGTAKKFQKSIEEKGLIPKKRLYVHLSSDLETAQRVGKRHGAPIIYRIDTKKMIQDGYEFYLSANKVWLIKAIPARYIKLV
ncbi:RNA 2'-phosphotransferase [Candidatus Epulonipiscioides gigas]|nr:RNA 2'-phosphotransferase [Epulopiscium sp. SCG-C07WGA-EpuloA2]